MNRSDNNNADRLFYRDLAESAFLSPLESRNAVIVNEQQQTNPVYIYAYSLDSDRSRTTVRSLLRGVTAFLSQKSVTNNDVMQFPWQELRKTHLLHLKDYMKQQALSPAYINLTLAVIRGVLKECWQLQLITHADYANAVSVKGVRGSRQVKPRLLANDELNSLLNVCRRDPSIKGIRDAAIIGLMRGCGLRRSEVVGLTLNNIDFTENSLTLIGKGNKQRKLFLIPKVRDLIDEWLDYREKSPGYLFKRILKNDEIGKTGAPLSHQAIYFILQQRSAEAGIYAIKPHAMRRKFCTDLLEKGVDLSTVQELMGHSSIETTKGYDLRGEQRMKDAVMNNSW
ncbi:tyrosine-type recombinase/integrase [Plesiomonas sp.]|uniref:tyrosine-type recombinase/integrase n=1 Tax=Plesiomonas sp. TaxID=2486279 RepID=UPI003F317497